MAKKERAPGTSDSRERNVVVEFPDKFAEFVSRNGRSGRADGSAMETHRSVETGVGDWTLVLGAAGKH